MVNITLSPEHEALVREKVEPGEYKSVSDVVSAAVQHFLDEEDKLRRLKAALQVGLDQIERGEYREYTPEVHAEILANARRKAAEGVTPDPDVVP